MQQPVSCFIDPAAVIKLGKKPQSIWLGLMVLVHTVEYIHIM